MKGKVIQRVHEGEKLTKVILGLGVSNFYVWGLVFLRLGVSNSYVWELVIVTFGC